MLHLQISRIPNVVVVKLRTNKTCFCNKRNTLQTPCRIFAHFHDYITDYNPSNIFLTHDWSIQVTTEYAPVKTG